LPAVELLFAIFLFSAILPESREQKGVWGLLWTSAFFSHFSTGLLSIPGKFLNRVK
jgi:hypothetical protein